MKRKNKQGWFISKSNIIYVQGSIDGNFVRYSTKKVATSLNISWIKKNYQRVLLQLYEDKTKEEYEDILFLDFYEKILEEKKSFLSYNTSKNYILIYRKHIKPYFKGIYVKDLKRIHFTSWWSKLLTLDISKGTAKTIRACLSVILQEAYENNLTENTNLLPRFSFPKNKQQEKKIDAFTLDEVSKITTNSKEKYKHILTILFFTGMRLGELCALKWKDIDFNNNLISISRTMTPIGETPPKTKSSIRTIEMLPIVKESLLKQKESKYSNKEYVLITNRNKPYKDFSSINLHYWRKLLKELNIPQRVIYQTRHTFATIMISNGEDIVWVSKMLGHSSVKTTLDKYTKYS